MQKCKNSRKNSEKSGQQFDTPETFPSDNKNKTREAFDKSQQDEIDRIIPKLIDFCERMKPCRRAKIRLESGEVRMILLCLNEWRNRFITTGKADAAAGVGEVMVRFAR